MATSDQTNIFLNIMQTLHHVESSSNPAATLVAGLGCPRYLSLNTAQCIARIGIALFYGTKIHPACFHDWTTLLEEQTFSVRNHLIQAASEIRKDSYSLWQLLHCPSHIALHMALLQAYIFIQEYTMWIPFRSRRLNCDLDYYHVKSIPVPWEGLLCSAKKRKLALQRRYCEPDFSPTMSMFPPPGRMEYESTKFRPIFMCNPPCTRHYNISGEWHAIPDYNLNSLKEIFSPTKSYDSRVETCVTVTSNFGFLGAPTTGLVIPQLAASTSSIGSLLPKPILHHSSIQYTTSNESKEEVSSTDIVWRKQDTSLCPTLGSTQPPFGPDEIASYDGTTIRSPLSKTYLQQYIARAVRKSTVSGEIEPGSDISKWTILLQAMQNGAKIKHAGWELLTGKQILENFHKAHSYAETGYY